MSHKFAAEVAANLERAQQSIDAARQLKSGQTEENINDN